MAEVKQEVGRQQGNKKEIDLKEYYELIKRRFSVVAAVTILMLIAGLAINNRGNDPIQDAGVPLYESSTRMIINAGDSNMSTLLVMIKDPMMLDKVIKKLDLDKTPEGLANQITVAVIDESKVIKVSAVDEDAKVAADIVNTTVNVFKKEIPKILNFDDIRLLTPAKESFSPLGATGSQGLSLKIFLVAGIVLGIGVVFVIDSLDGTIKKEKEIEELLGVPAVGAISNMNKKKWEFKKNKNRKLPVRGEAFDVE